MPLETYQITNLNLTEINRVLDMIALRLNFMKNDGDDISLNNTKFTNLASAVAAADAVRKDQVTLLSDLAAIILGTTDEITVTDNGDETVTLSLPGAIKLDSATASRLLATNGSKKTASADLASWVTGTTDELDVTDDGDGTITLSVPSEFLSRIVCSGGNVVTSGGEVTWVS